MRVESLRERRLLARAGFGPRPGDASGLATEGAEAWVARQLAAGSPPDPDLDRRLASFPALELQLGDALGELDMRTMVRSEDGRAMLKERTRAVAGDVLGARLVRSVHGAWGVREAMIDFWSNHFSVFARKAFVGLLLPHYQRDVIERHALGRFEDLLVAVAKSPAMLVYLDNWLSMSPQGLLRRARRLKDRGLNENYARELLELHTLGVDGGYTQQDVVEVARAFTGWGLRGRRDPLFEFRDRLHDPGAKRVMGERVRGEGIEEGLGLLRRLARHPSTARHLSRKLVTRFVADAAPPALVERAAQRFLETEGEIREVLRVILLSPELSEPAHRKLKTPLRLAASALRASGGETDGSRGLVLYVARLGEMPYLSRTPDGFPEHAARWIEPGALLERMALAFALARGHLPGARLGPEPIAPGLRLADGLPRWERRALEIAAPEFQWV